MEFLLYIIHIGVCFVLIMVVLLQSGKAADLAGAFGGGGSQTALGSRGAATVLSKATTICAVVFMLTSLGLALIGSRTGGSVLEQVPVQTPAAAPAAPEGSAPAAPAEPTAAPPAGGSPPGDAGSPGAAAPGTAAPAGQAPPADAGKAPAPPSPH